ncbi:MAG: hypothetical protein JXX14_00415 [Deltaproteobacteria bacterium]|nr:hypothetical protein [Deltaproteobacteria bacterium]
MAQNRLSRSAELKYCPNQSQTATAHMIFEKAWGSFLLQWFTLGATDTPSLAPTPRAADTVAPPKAKRKGKNSKK